MKVLFAGGGTMGPVTPLLAVWEAWRAIDPEVDAIWVGTPHGPERQVVEGQGISFVSLPKARFPRYPSVEWLLFPFRFVWAFAKAFRLLSRQKPDVVASAGGYTAVPVIFAANILGIRIWVHQQDVELILTNKLTIPWADRVTVAWEKNRNELGHRAKLVGNPVRPSVLAGSRDRAVKSFGLNTKKPTVLVFGGGSGAAWINMVVEEVADQLSKKANVIHVTGRGKSLSSKHVDHYVYEFLDKDMADALAVSDVVVCRAGLATITELAGLSKASVMIPLPNSPQESNAKMVEDACVVLDQQKTSGEYFLNEVVKLLDDDNVRKELGKKMHTKLRTHIADELVEMLKNL